MGPLYGVAVNSDGSLLAAVGEGGEKLWRIGQQANGRWEFADEVRFQGQKGGCVGSPINESGA